MGFTIDSKYPGVRTVLPNNEKFVPPYLAEPDNTQNHELVGVLDVLRKTTRPLGRTAHIANRIHRPVDPNQPWESNGFGD